MIGFRFFAVVTGNDTDPAYVQENANADGTDLMGMRFRVNGAAMYARGANMIPMDELEGRYDADAHAQVCSLSSPGCAPLFTFVFPVVFSLQNVVATSQIVQSAADGNMNILRVWGGGVFLPDVFYDTCDQLGVLLYHDLQYAQQVPWRGPRLATPVAAAR